MAFVSMRVLPRADFGRFLYGCVIQTGRIKQIFPTMAYFAGPIPPIQGELPPLLGVYRLLILLLERGHGYPI